jgi:hypothetical protein
MAKHCTVDLRNQPGERAWTYEPLAVPGVSLISVLDGDGLEQSGEDYELSGAKLSWSAARAVPSQLRLVLAIAEASEQPARARKSGIAKHWLPIVLALIPVAPALWGLRLSSEQEDTKRELSETKASVKSAQDKLASCNKDLDAKRHREITEDLLGTLRLGGGAQP